MKKESGNHGIASHLRDAELATDVKVGLDPNDPGILDRCRAEARHQLSSRDRVGQAAIGGERRERRDEGLKSQEDNQDAVQRSRESAGNKRRRQDQIAGDVKYQRQVENDHPDQPDDSADRQIYAPHQNRERLAHREDGDKRETRHQVLDVGSGSETGRAHAEERERRGKEQDQCSRSGTDRHVTEMPENRAAAQYAAAQTRCAVYQRWEG